MMLINLKELAAKDQAVRLHEKLDMSDLLKGRQDLADFGELVADLEAVSHSGVAVVEGSMTLPVTMYCSRCLEETHQELNIPFREEFTKDSANLPEDEPDDMHLVTEDRIDLKPFVEETVWMELPYIPLCREDCLGLCPVCGNNRNEKECGCNREKIDPRMAGLADFFNKDK